MAGVVGMVPEGLVLLTSIAFGLAAVTLARRKVLVQELPAVEGLARVDVVCLDKTGTLTEGIVEFERIELLDAQTDEPVVHAALGALNHDEGRQRDPGGDRGRVPGSGRVGAGRAGAVLVGSEVERGGVREQRRLGARGARDGVARPVGPRPAPGRRARVDRQPGVAAGPGRRARGRGAPYRTRVRSRSSCSRRRCAPDAAETLDYFHEQGVALKVISGDNPRTVGAVARRVGLPDAGGAGRRARAPGGHRRACGCPRRPRGLRAGHPAAEARDGRRRCSRAATSSR